MKTIVTVDRVKLIQELKSKLKLEEFRVIQEQAQYGEALKAARKKHLSLVLEYAASLKEGGEAVDSSYDLKSRLPYKAPKEPKPVNPEYARAIKKLELMVPEEIYLRDEDEYLKLI
jgi:hypothetical protein